LDRESSSEYPFPKCCVRYRQSKKSNFEEKMNEDQREDIVINNELEERRPLRNKLFQNHSVSYDEPARRFQLVQKSNSLPRALNAHEPNVPSPLAQSRARFSQSRQATFETDIDSVVFKRTPIDLMKQNASLLTNILCLALCLSLVLVTVVQFSGNETMNSKWKAYEEKIDLKIGKLSKEVGVFSDDQNGIIFENGTRSENVTNIDPDLLQSILKMKKWYFENNKLLKDMKAKSKYLAQKKNVYDTVFGTGLRRGLLDRIQGLEVTVKNIREEIETEKQRYQKQFGDLRNKVLDVKNLLNTSLAMINREKRERETQLDKLSRRMNLFYDNLKRNNATTNINKDKTDSLAKILQVALANISTLDDDIKNLEKNA